MKKVLLVLAMTAAMLCIATSAQANLILNGSFENTSSTGCDSNLSNVAFTSKMSDATAFGTGNELDIYTGSCFGPAAIDGQVKVNLVSADAFTLHLSSTLKSGTTYDLSFYTAALSAFGANLDSVRIGASSSATSFGTLIFTAVSTVADTWEFFSTSFVAGTSVDFIAVQGSPTAYSWHSLDNFVLTERVDSISVPEPGTLALLGLGLVGIGMRSRRRIKAS